MAKRKHRKIALERIEVLFDQAEEAVRIGEISRANRYVELARKIGMKYNVPLPSEHKRRVCKNCYSYLYPGVTCRVRLREGKMITVCNRCGTVNRYIYKGKDSNKSGDE